MNLVFLPHARERMELYGISEDEARIVIEDADEEGTANFGRLYSQKQIGQRRIRVIYNQGVDVIIVISVMLRRREGELS